MEIISIRTKILTGLITGGILLSSVSTTSAVTSKSLNIIIKAPLTNEYKQINTKILRGLDINSADLVTSNTITQNQADKIKTVINKSHVTKQYNFGKTNTITNQKRKIYMYSNMLNHINPFTNLVDNGTITQAQADKIIMKQLYLCHGKK